MTSQLHRLHADANSSPLALIDNQASEIKAMVIESDSSNWVPSKSQRLAGGLASRSGLMIPPSISHANGLCAQFSGFIGIADLEFAYASSLNMGDESWTGNVAVAYSEPAKFQAEF